MTDTDKDRWLCSQHSMKRFFRGLAGLPILAVMFVSLVGGKRTENFRVKCAGWMKRHLG